MNDEMEEEEMERREGGTVLKERSAGDDSNQCIDDWS